MTDKQRHSARVQRLPAASLPNWVIFVIPAGVALAAYLARHLG